MLGDLPARLIEASREHEEPIVRDVARRAGLLWQCGRCQFDNPRGEYVCDGCAAALADVCQPGAPDPTLAGLGSRSVEHCRQRNDVGMRCTRPAGHPPAQHVAGDGETVTAVWPVHETYTSSTYYGPATLSVVAIEVDIELFETTGNEPYQVPRPVWGDRAVLRRHVEGKPHEFAVYERAHSSRYWCRITPSLAPTQLTCWSEHRHPASGTGAPSFDQWLSAIAEGYRTNPARRPRRDQ